MLTLEQAQANFIATINDGPDALDHSIFEGPIDRVLLGLKAHANTVSHARLVALEETFPLTRQEMGESVFNALSRSFIETAQARARDTNALGSNFPCFLRAQSVGAAHCDLAAIEWAWLESYHAPEAIALAANNLADLDEGSLLAMPVSPHPSLKLVMITAPLANSLEMLAGQQPTALATIRPKADVCLLPLGELECALAFRLQEKNCTLGNLLEAALEQADDADPLGPVMMLIGAGALVLRR